MSLQRIEQLLRLAGSENDHEALAALRALIRLKTHDGKDWNDFVAQLAAVQFGEKPAQPRPQAAARPETKPSEEAAFSFTFGPNPFDSDELFRAFCEASRIWRQMNKPPPREEPKSPPKPPQPTDEEKRAREAEDVKRREREDQKRREATREDEHRVQKGDFSGAARFSDGFVRRRPLFRF